MWYHYIWWIPTVILYYTLYAWGSWKNNTCGGKWFWIFLIIHLLCPWWIIVSKISKRLMFDGFLYDSIIFLSFALTLTYLGVGEAFTKYNWFGVVLVIIGLVLMKIH